MSNQASLNSYGISFPGSLTPALPPQNHALENFFVFREFREFHMLSILL
jgi:hypothetical protein